MSFLRWPLFSSFGFMLRDNNRHLREWNCKRDELKRKVLLNKIWRDFAKGMAFFHRNLVFNFSHSSSTWFWFSLRAFRFVVAWRRVKCNYTRLFLTIKGWQKVIFIPSSLYVVLLLLARDISDKERCDIKEMERKKYVHHKKKLA